MICGNCGFQNTPGDEFCGSCGHFLAWTGDQAGQHDAAIGSSLAGSAGDPPAGTPGALPSEFPTVVGLPAGSAPPAGSALPAGSAPPAGSASPPPGVDDPPQAQPQAAINWPAGLQRCDVCGTANELSRAFCLNCGSKLKRAGTTTGAALAVAAARAERRRGTLMVLYVIGGVFLFVVAAAAAFVAFGGLSPATTAPPVTQAASVVEANPSASLIAPGSALASEGLSPTDQPIATSPASLEPPATPVPSTLVTTQPPETAPPATVPPAGGFVCAASTFGASQPGGWRIVRSHWSHKGPADTLTLEMQPSDSVSSASVDASILPPDQVELTYGVPGPSSGEVAVVLAFNDSVGLSTPFGSSVGYKALQEFQMYRNAGRVYLVMGVNGSGCYGLASDAWTTGLSAAPELVVSLQH